MYPQAQPSAFVEAQWAVAFEPALTAFGSELSRSRPFKKKQIVHVYVYAYLFIYASICSCVCMHEQINIKNVTKHEKNMTSMCLTNG